MNTKLKRCLVVMLTLALCLQGMPTYVFAEDEQLDANAPTTVLGASDGEQNTTEDSSVMNEQTPDVSSSTPTLNDDQEADDAQEATQTNTDPEAEATGEQQEAQALPTVAYRVHRLGATSWGEGEGWTTFDAHQTSLEATQTTTQDELTQIAEQDNTDATPEATSSPAALDAIQLRCEDEALQAMEYRVRDATGIWQQAWTKAPDPASVKKGITGIEVRLPESAADKYDLWYRATTEDGTWLSWVRAGATLAAEDSALLYDFEALVTNKDVKPSVGTVATQDAQNQTSDSTEDTEEQPQAESQQQQQQAEEPTLATQDAKPVDDNAEAKNDSKESKVTTPTQQPAKTNTLKAEAEQIDPDVEYRAYTQKKGWLSWVKNGAVAGITGKGLGLEGIRLRLKNADGNIQYKAWVQGAGWQNWITNNKLAGTRKNRRVESLKIKLTGTVATTHNVYYRVYKRGYGWQDWVKNGAAAGNANTGNRIDAVEVILVRKGASAPFNGTSGTTNIKRATSAKVGVRYQVYGQNYGWQREKSNGKTAGTTSKSLRIEGLRVATTGLPGGIRYRAYVQKTGWQGWKSNGTLAGTTNKSQRIEALKLELTGEAKATHSVYYRVYLQDIGWMAWAKDGAAAGSLGRNARIEAIQVKVISNTSAAPENGSSFYLPFLGKATVTYNTHALGGSWLQSKNNGKKAGTTEQSGRIDLINATVSGVEGLGIRYSVASEAGNWQSWTYNGANTGLTGKRITGLRFKLTGKAASYYNVWYRAYVSGRGWLGWAKNGANAGSDSVGNPIEAYAVKITSKKASAPGSTAGAYYYARQLNGVDISGWNWGNGVYAPVNQVEGDFFIIKATEGVQGTIYNTRYKQMANQVLESGRLVGFYHYANGGDPLKEADSFYDAIKDYKGRAIACLDWEGAGNKLFDTGKDVAWCKKFLDRLKLRFGGTPLLYTSKNYTNAYDWSSVAKSYPLWGAEYPDYEDIYGYQSNPWQSSRPWGAWGKYPTIFQYTGTGVLKKNGGCDHFDFDLFYGSTANWRSLQG